MRVRGTWRDPGNEAAPEFLYSEPLRALFEKFATDIEYDDEAGALVQSRSFIRSTGIGFSFTEAYTWRFLIRTGRTFGGERRLETVLREGQVAAGHDCVGVRVDRPNTTEYDRPTSIVYRVLYDETVTDALMSGGPCGVGGRHGRATDGRQGMDDDARELRVD